MSTRWPHLNFQVQQTTELNTRFSQQQKNQSQVLKTSIFNCLPTCTFASATFPTIAVSI
jgi:hypothetical protein